MIKLNSSAIYGVEYDSYTLDMYIWFASGGPYTFRGVPERVYMGLLNASSPGSYYNTHIRGRYR